MASVIHLEVLEDGTAKFTTDAINDPIHHKSADELLDEAEEMLGGKRSTEHLKKHGHRNVHKNLTA